MAFLGCHDAVLVVQVPTGLIVACSRPAANLLDPHGGSVVGERLEKFTADAPSGALPLFAQGRINEYTADRSLTRRSKDELWVSLCYKRFGRQAPSRFALVAITVGGSSPPKLNGDYPPDVSARSPRKPGNVDLPGMTDLTTRERDMLTRLVAGYRVGNIAADLVLSPSTVRTHLGSIFAKLGVSNQSDLLTALRSGS
jgi:DNA-binding CsgD family transcriptional regulator